jgi:predicted regulator of Ras-like GTPase activity (Roadblock/LC7/MglB family)
MENDTAIQPMKLIQGQVEDFLHRIPVWSVSLFTIDGYVLNHRSMSDRIPPESDMVLSTMSAGLISIAEDMIRMVDHGMLFSQIVIDAEGQYNNECFSIILKHLAENVLLACVFPNSIHLGLVTFEIQNLSIMIGDIVREWDVKLHSETMT